MHQLSIIIRLRGTQLDWMGISREELRTTKTYQFATAATYYWRTPQYSPYRRRRRRRRRRKNLRRPQAYSHLLQTHPISPIVRQASGPKYMPSTLPHSTLYISTRSPKQRDGGLWRLKRPAGTAVRGGHAHLGAFAQTEIA
jgi:hypothetical protein